MGMFSHFSKFLSKIFNKYYYYLDDSIPEKTEKEHSLLHDFKTSE